MNRISAFAFSALTFLSGAALAADAAKATSEPAPLSAAGAADQYVENAKQFVLAPLDENKDGKVPKAEFSKVIKPFVEELDANKDGLLSKDEILPKKEQEAAIRDSRVKLTARLLAFHALKEKPEALKVSDAISRGVEKAFATMDLNNDGVLSVEDIKQDYQKRVAAKAAASQKAAPAIASAASKSASK